MKARALKWGYLFDCGCLLFQVGAVVTLKACRTSCPNRGEALALLESRQRLARSQS